MGKLSVRIPDSIHAEIKKLSKEEKISINQFIASAVTEKVTALETENYLLERSSKADREKFLKILEKVPDIESTEME